MKYLKLFEGRNKYDDIEKVRAFFKELVGDEYEVLDKSNDLKNSRPLPFDFYLPDYNMCIEYDGIQHFIPIEYFGGEKSLIYNQMIDKKKSDYCSEKGIKLVRLTYLDIKKIRQLLDEVFNEL